MPILVVTDEDDGGKNGDGAVDKAAAAEANFLLALSYSETIKTSSFVV